VHCNTVYGPWPQWQVWLILLFMAIGGAIAGGLWHRYLPASATTTGESALPTSPTGARRREPPTEAVSPEGPGPEVLSDLWTFLPDDYERHELDIDHFDRAGGIDSQGVAPTLGLHLETSDDWPLLFHKELRQGLVASVVVQGVELDRVGCVVGRCLVELRFLDMDLALERAAALRQWADGIPCRSYSDGPEESERPGGQPSQQVWILCGTSG
jgi:hypothetical protein